VASVSANSGISQNQLVANALNKQNESEDIPIAKKNKLLGKYLKSYRSVFFSFFNSKPTLS
jgi:hypothetical protein|tara:strand:+ start:992 stop:1174 length:183 start_codon:yes stop_codon:yes gene_type:complete